jgi:hypothetical protein
MERDDEDWHAWLRRFAIVASLVLALAGYFTIRINGATADARRIAEQVMAAAKDGRAEDFVKSGVLAPRSDIVFKMIERDFGPLEEYAIASVQTHHGGNPMRVDVHTVRRGKRYVETITFGGGPSKPCFPSKPQPLL